MTDGPRVPLDHREEQVATLLGSGWSYKRIAAKIGLKTQTVRTIAVHAADKFENPDGLTPQMLLCLWAAHRRWEHERTNPIRPAA